MSKKKDKKRKSKKLGLKQQKKMAKKAAKVIVNNSIIINEFKKLFMMNQASDKKIKKHVTKMINRYLKHLDKKDHELFDDWTPPKNPGIKEETENSNDDIKSLMDNL